MPLVMVACWFVSWYMIIVKCITFAGFCVVFDMDILQFLNCVVLILKVYKVCALCFLDCYKFCVVLALCL